MKISMKLVFLILILTVTLLEAKLNLWGQLFSRKAIIDYIFPKNPDLVRVRYPNQVQTQINNVTTLDFVSTSKLFFIKDIFEKIMA